MAKIAAFLGSPRAGGNTEILLDTALQGARDAGAKVEKINLWDLDFSGCIECEDCYATGECSLVDEMGIVYEALESSDRILLASPIFFMGLPAQAKAMIDRCQCYWAQKYILKEEFPATVGSRRYGAFIGVGATRGEKLFDGTILTLKYFFDAVSAEPLSDEYLLVRGVDEKGAIKEDTDLIEASALLGRTLATKP
jgi:multimeric flavodoxin WrbA